MQTTLLLNRSVRFTPDVRTEFLPMLNIPAGHESRWDHAVYDASALAEAITADKFKSLAPLVDGYEAWIEASFDSETRFTKI